MLNIPSVSLPKGSARHLRVPCNFCHVLYLYRYKMGYVLVVKVSIEKGEIKVKAAHKPVCNLIEERIKIGLLIDLETNKHGSDAANAH